MSKSSIFDTRIRVYATDKLLNTINLYKDSISEIPENVAKALKAKGFSLNENVEILKADFNYIPPKIDNKLLDNLLNTSVADTTTTKKDIPNEINEKKNNQNSGETKKIEVYLYLNDLRWLNNWLSRLRKEKDIDIFLHNIIETSFLELPENQIIERNPELEARCQKLREEQQNREYRKMTKNVDSTLKNYPEDTIAYQMKSLNSQIIAVLQFVFSVIAGFVFGFLGIQLIVGNLDFGLRLLLGIMFALIIALAEIYFLAKKLNEYDEVVDTSHQPTTSTKKLHID